MSRATNAERSPLLRIQSRPSDAPSFSVADVAPSTLHITAVGLLLAAAHQAASVLAARAAADLNQAAVCRRLHGPVADPADDERCRALAVQLELASLATTEAVLTRAMAVLAPIPIGVAADRFGRRPFLVLALVGSVLDIASRMFICLFCPSSFRVNNEKGLIRNFSKDGLPQVFPVRLTWLSASFGLFAGGRNAFFAIIYTIITDVTSKAQR